MGGIGYRRSLAELSAEAVRVLERSSVGGASEKRRIWDARKEASEAQEEGGWLLVHAASHYQVKQVLHFLETIECDVHLAPEPNVPLVFGRAGLTEREIDVLQLLGKGCKYHEIASILKCQVSTIQQHIKHLYKKLNVHSRSEAVHEAVQMGLINL